MVRIEAKRRMLGSAIPTEGGLPQWKLYGILDAATSLTLNRPRRNE